MRVRPQRGTAPQNMNGRDDRWIKLREEFLERVDSAQRAAAATLLLEPRQGGRGLRSWLRRLHVDERPLPMSLPHDLVQVYLDHSEVEPLYDCADCGLAIPVEVGWQRSEALPLIVYFETCPCCGGQTGLHAYWSREDGGRRDPVNLATVVVEIPILTATAGKSNSWLVGDVDSLGTPGKLPACSVASTEVSSVPPSTPRKPR